MAQQNIDFGSFPDDPSADAIQTAFQKVQNNFNQLFSTESTSGVTSVNRTPGAGITVNNSTGNVIVSANIACVQVSTSSLSIGRNGNGGTSASITQSSSQTLVLDINPNLVQSNNFTAVGGGLANLSGTLTVAASAQPNITSLGNLSVANITGNLLAANICANSTISSNVISANTISSNGFIIHSVGTAITATGTTQANSTPLTNSINVITSGATGSGVVLPTATAGMTIYITNLSANVIKIYPAVGATINNNASNTSVNLSSNITAYFIAPTATQWFTVSNLQ
jgi:hypothetical protein